MMNEKDAEILRSRAYNIKRGGSLWSKEDILRLVFDRNISSDKFVFLGTEHSAIAEKIRERDETQFTYFSGLESPFSLEHDSTFTSPINIRLGIKEELREYLRNSLPKELTFSSVEQFLVYHKAITFMDREIADRVMQTSNLREIEELDQQVKNYDKGLWKYLRSDIVFEAYEAKLGQNPDLMEALKGTAGTTLVNAAPNDEIWGIGLAADNPNAQHRETWEGKNVLGEILTFLRVDYMGQY